MAAVKGIVAFIILIVAVVLLWYFTEGLRLPGGSSTSAASTTSTGSGPSTSGTTIPGTTSIIYTQNCGTFTLFTGSYNATEVSDCNWRGGPLGIWVGGGNTGAEQITMVGADNITYLNQSSTYQCVTFWKNITIPAQTYKVTLMSGPGTLNKSSTCTYAMAIMNTTLNPPTHVVYNNFVYNGNFSSGTYSGWNVTGKGFGTSPLNITFANGNLNVTPANSVGNNNYTTANTAAGCYIGSKWSNYVGSYIATTYMCGTQVSPGNITSSPFFSSYPFLNFKIISPQNQNLYVEILYNGTPEIIAHYDTYNTSLGANASSTFRNASIPLVTVINKPIQIKVVADTQLPQNFIAVGDFQMARIPSQTKGILVNIT